jgi:hypothetical protein
MRGGNNPNEAALEDGLRQIMHMAQAASEGRPARELRTNGPALSRTVGKNAIASPCVVAYSQTMEMLTPDEIGRLSPPERIAPIAQLWDSPDADHLARGA